MSQWPKENNTDKVLKIILFLMSPLLAALYSVKRMNTLSSYVVFFLFAILFGMAFTVSLDASIDGAYYRSVFERYVFVTDVEYFNGLKNFLSFQDIKDYYIETLAFIVSRFTQNYHWLFMVASIPFAFFSLKSLRILTSEEKFDYSFASLILVYIFMINGIFNINGMRFWTAAWVGVYCLFQIFRNDNKWYFLLLFLTPFMHGAYWYFIILLLFIYSFKNLNRFWVSLFFFSFFVGNFILEVFQDLSGYLPTFMQKMIDSYTSAEYLGKYSAGSGFYWVARLFGFATRIYITIMVLLFIQNATLIKSNPKTKNLYLFLIPYMVFVNFTLVIPSLGGRFMSLAYPVIAYIWLVNFKGKKYRDYLYYFPLVFGMNIFQTVFVRYPSVADITFYLTSPFYSIYKYLLAFY